MKNKTKLLLALCFLSVSVLRAQNGAHTLIASGPCDPIIPILCPSGVVNANLAVDNDLNTAAQMETAIGVLSGAFLKIGFTNPAPGGYTIAVFVDQATILDLTLLGTITLTAYDAGGNVVKQKVGFTAADVALDEDNHGLLLMNIPSKKTVSSIQISLSSLLTVLNTLNIYGADYAPNNTPVFADYVFAQSNVTNANNAVSSSKTDYALLSIPLGVAGSAYLDLGFTKPGAIGSSVYFTLGTNSDLLDASFLDNLNMTVYDANGNILKQKNGFTLADVTILSGNQFRIHLKTKLTSSAGPARVRVTLNSLISVVTDLRAYNAYWKGNIVFSSYFPRTAEQAVNTSDITIYPNPASGFVNVNWNNAQGTSATINIVNMMGQSVYVGTISADENKKIDISRFNNGVYLLRINEEGTIQDQKFLIQK